MSTEIKYTPSWRRENSRIRNRSSKRSGRDSDFATDSFFRTGLLRRCSPPVPPITFSPCILRCRSTQFQVPPARGRREPATSAQDGGELANSARGGGETATPAQGRGEPGISPSGNAILQPGHHIFLLNLVAFSRRVKGAWWPPRSSKPLSVCFAGRGKFDSYPLRQLSTRIRKYDDVCRGDFGCWGRRSSRARPVGLGRLDQRCLAPKSPGPLGMGRHWGYCGVAPTRKALPGCPSSARLALPPMTLPHTSPYLRTRVLRERR